MAGDEGRRTFCGRGWGGQNGRRSGGPVGLRQGCSETVGARWEGVAGMCCGEGRQGGDVFCEGRGTCGVWDWVEAAVRQCGCVRVLSGVGSVSGYA